MEEGALKSKPLGGKYEAKLKFPGRRGGRKQKKTFMEGSMDIFWNYRLSNENTDVPDAEPFDKQEFLQYVVFIGAILLFTMDRKPLFWCLWFDLMD